MMRLKNILHLTDFLEKRIKVFLENKINDIIDSKVKLIENKYECSILSLENKIKDLEEKNNLLDEENKAIKTSCINLTNDIQMIAQAIGQIYVLTEKAVSTESDSDWFEESLLDIKDKKKKKEYH